MVGYSWGVIEPGTNASSARHGSRSPPEKGGALIGEARDPSFKTTNMKRLLPAGLLLAFLALKEVSSSNYLDVAQVSVTGNPHGTNPPSFLKSLTV